MPIDKSNKKGYTESRNVPFVEKLPFWKHFFRRHVSSLTVNLLKPHQSSTPHKGQTGEAMRSYPFTAPWGRLIGTLFALIFLIFGLAACGGGGGSSTPTDPPSKKVVSLAGEATFVSKTGVPVLATAVTSGDEIVVPCIAEGTTCTASATFVCGAQSQAGTQKNVTATSVQFGHSADLTVGACTLSVTASATGMTSATKDFTFTVTTPKKVPVASATTLAFDAGYIPQAHHLYADGTYETVPPVNKTGLLIGACIIGREVKPVSQPINCSDSTGVRHNLTWNKTAMKIVAYDGSSGVPPVITDSSFWLDVSGPDVANGWTSSSTVTNGTAYTKSDRHLVYFRETGTTKEVLMSADLGTIKALTGF